MRKSKEARKSPKKPEGIRDSDKKSPQIASFAKLRKNEPF